MIRAVKKAKKSLSKTEQHLEDFTRLIELAQREAKILIVEDDSAFCFFLTKKLEQSDLSFKIVKSLKEALSLTYSPDLIFADVNLPDSNSIKDIEVLKNKYKDAVLFGMSACEDYKKEGKQNSKVFKFIAKNTDIYRDIQLLSKGLING